MLAAGTDPDSPRFGARKIGMKAADPAFSTRSPMRTSSPFTVTLAFSAGVAGAPPVCAAAAVDRAISAKSAVKRNISQSPLPHQLRGGLQHLVGSRDHLRVHLIGALGGDQVRDLGDRVDVRLLEIALLQAAVAVDAGDAVLRRPRRRRVDE